MNIDSFAIWKFKNIEGVLKNFYGYDFLISKYQKGTTVFFIKYDLTAETATFTSDSDLFLDGLTCPLKDLHTTLKNHSYFELKNKNDCHSSATWNNELFK